MIHIYCGDGKGKTTAACGLAFRAASSGMRVLIAQFFKDGSSSEILGFSALPMVDVLHAEKHFGRYKMMRDAERAEAAALYSGMLSQIAARAPQYQMIVLDESLPVYRHGLIGSAALLDFLRREGNLRELVLTGRDPAPELVALADYVTEMKKVKHPFDLGIKARRGIEY